MLFEQTGIPGSAINQEKTESEGIKKKRRKNTTKKNQSKMKVRQGTRSMEATNINSFVLILLFLPKPPTTPSRSPSNHGSDSSSAPIGMRLSKLTSFQGDTKPRALSPSPPHRNSNVQHRDTTADNERTVSDLCDLRSCVSLFNVSPVSFSRPAQP